MDKVYISGKKVSQALGKKGRTNLMKPYVPNFQIIAANITDVPVDPSL